MKLITEILVFVIAPIVGLTLLLIGIRMAIYEKKPTPEEIEKRKEKMEFVKKYAEQTKRLQEQAYFEGREAEFRKEEEFLNRELQKIEDDIE